MKDRIIRYFLCAALSGIICYAVDVFAAFYEHYLNLWILVLMWILVSLILALTVRNLRFLVCTVLASVALISVLFMSWKYFRSDSSYEPVYNDKQEMYADKTVIFFVPHEDDELNIGSGVIEEFLKYGSSVYVVFATNGDMLTEMNTRLDEAVSVMDSVGVDPLNIIFLGYPDGMLKELYLSDGDSIITASSGLSSKYGSEKYSIYNRHESFCRKNVISDISGLISQISPDYIFVNDYDWHSDHQALSLFVEEALCNVIKADSSYHPSLFKAFLYPFAFFGYDNFYDDINLVSTKNIYETDCIPLTNTYLWSERVRFPVDAGGLSRSIYYSDLYCQEALYTSQSAVNQAGRVISSDRVYWYRSTESDVIAADVSATSGIPEYVNDLKIYDSNEAYESGRIPSSGVWIPDDNDTDKSVTVKFSHPKNVNLIRVFDNPSAGDNITSAIITFDNGSSYETGQLKECGAFTEIEVNEKNVSSFTFRIISYEGDYPGVSEIECYSDPGSIIADTDFIKLEDSGSNFAYDYIMGLNGNGVFSVYSPYGENTDEQFAVSCEGDNCSASVADGVVCVFCPLYHECTVTVKSTVSGLSDSIKISNPGLFYRLGWIIDKYYYYHSEFLDRTVLHGLITSI